MKKVLLCEDDDGIIGFVEAELLHEGFRVDVCHTGREALALNPNDYDLILLDIMIPEINGLEVLRRIRLTSSVPIILETARGETIDKISGLNSGADDYISKPYDIEELLARINAVLRRTSKTEDDLYTYKEMKLDLSTMGCIINNNALNLSKTEFLMLKYFLENRGKVVSRMDIKDAIWGKDHFLDINTVDVYIGYLRNKIAAYSDLSYIRTVRGSGYTMEKS